MRKLGRIIIVLLVIVLIGSVAAGVHKVKEAISGSRQAAVQQEQTAEQLKAEAEQKLEEAAQKLQSSLPGQDAAAQGSAKGTGLQASDVMGTWKVTAVEKDGNHLTVELLHSLGNDELAETYLIFYGDKNVKFAQKNELIGQDTWSIQGETIATSESTMTIKDGELRWDLDGEVLCLVKFSDSTTVVSLDSAQAPAAPEEPANEPASQGGSNVSGSTRPEDEISPELKEFLDAYEACIDEYVAFMEHYNASDYSQLLTYLGVLEKYTNMAARADDWDAEDMTDAEYLYYLQVMNRCSEKLVKAGLSMN